MSGLQLFKAGNKFHPAPVQISKGHGLDLGLGAVPDASEPDERTTRMTALLGRDYPGTRFKILVEEGQTIRSGEPLFCDRRFPNIRFTSPASGEVSAIQRGARRTLVSVQVRRNGSGDIIEHAIPRKQDAAAIRDLLMESGLWAAIRSRPYGIVPNPDQDPGALLVTAIDTEPLAPDPNTIIAQHMDDFIHGVEAMASCVECDVTVCTDEQARHQFDAGSRVRTAVFSGAHPAGLAGVHINRLAPIGLNGGSVWHIGYQDVISIGHLMRSGYPWMERIISVAGPGTENPKVLKVPLGASVTELIANESIDKNFRAISGSVLSGHAASGYEDYLGQRHRQVTVLPGVTGETEEPKSPPVRAQGRKYGPMLPVADIDRYSPPGILATPLLRALLVGDVDRARELGALELVEEDVALLSYACPSGVDYGVLLREILDQLYLEVA